tara:strand:+ start:1088 stop:1795 length:708 start_codon:yes stop_codon:yes gene_type:complete
MEQEKYRIGKRYLGPRPPMSSKFNVDFLILGHPRSGTGYISKLFSGYGIKIGHECIDEHGISCWTFVTPNCNHFNGVPKKGQRSIKGITRQDIEYKHLVHNVRNPFDVINSIYQTEANTHSQIFRLFHAEPKIDENLDTLSQTILSVTRWNKMIEQLNPEVVFKVEDCEECVKDYLVNNLNYKTEGVVFENKSYNTRKKSREQKLTKEDYANVPQYVLDELNEYCERYNYTNILK